MAFPEITVPYLGQIITAALVIAAAYLALKVGKKIILLVLNSLAGIVLLLVVSSVPAAHVSITLWTILISLAGGIAGVILLLVLGQLGIAL